jgi:hypothetical protein
MEARVTRETREAREAIETKGIRRARHVGEVQSIACSTYVSHEFVAYFSEKNSLSDDRGPSEDDRGPQNFGGFSVFTR